MTYHLSASKLQTYKRCPKSYQYRYEIGLPRPAFFGAASLGTALHQTLAQIYRDWHYLEPIPDIDWIKSCWQQNCGGLSAVQIQEGLDILNRYYQTHIANRTALRRPLAVEGKIQGSLQAENLEFGLKGRYDRLDWCDNESGLELIDYKSTKDIKLPETSEIDLQIGLYYLALEQHYHQSLKQLSLVFLRTGEKVSFRATPSQKQQVEEIIGELAVRLRQDSEWQPAPGEQCGRCSYSRYCAAIQTQPEPLPKCKKSLPQLQLTLGL